MSPRHASQLLEPTNPIYSFLVPVRGLPCNQMAPDTYDAWEWDFRKARLHCNYQEVGGQCIETGACPAAPSVYFQDFQRVADTWASPLRTREYLCSGNYKLLVADSPKWYGWKKKSLCVLVGKWGIIRLYIGEMNTFLLNHVISACIDSSHFSPGTVKGQEPFFFG